jgi:hypothetical protein
MGKVKRDWQNSEYVLTFFGQNRYRRRNYQQYVQKGVALGRRPELVGGGLVRSLGGWSEVLALRGRGEKQRSDQRILEEMQIQNPIGFKKGVNLNIMGPAALALNCIESGQLFWFYTLFFALFSPPLLQWPYVDRFRRDPPHRLRKHSFDKLAAFLMQTISPGRVVVFHFLTSQPKVKM